MQGTNAIVHSALQHREVPKFLLDYPLVRFQISVDETGQELQCHLPCTRGRANAPSIQAVLFERRYLGVPPQLRPEVAHKNQHRHEESGDCQFDTHNGQILKRSSRLNILQRRLQFPQFTIHSSLRLLRALHSLHLKGLNGFDLPSHIVCGWFERLEVSFDFIDYGRVVQGAAVLLEIDRLRLRA